MVDERATRMVMSERIVGAITSAALEDQVVLCQGTLCHCLGFAIS